MEWDKANQIALIKVLSSVKNPNIVDIISDL